MSDTDAAPTDAAPAKTDRLPFWALAPLVFVGALGGLSLWTLLQDPADREALPSALIDKPAPEFSLPGLREGAPGLSTADLAAPGAKVVNIWASWCGPCRVEHPDLMELAAKGVTVHGINYKDDPGNAAGFLTELGDPFALIGADRSGRTGIEWGVYGVPETFVLDGNGRIVLKHVGPIQNDDLEAKILPALRAAGWTPPEG